MSRKSFKAANWVEDAIGVSENKGRLLVRSLTKVGVRERGGAPAVIYRETKLTVTVWGVPFNAVLKELCYSNGVHVGYVYWDSKHKIAAFGNSERKAATAFQRVAEGWTVTQAVIGKAVDAVIEYLDSSEEHTRV